MKQVGGQGFGKVVQVAYLVPDVDEAMRNWLEQLGVGPWTCIRNIELDAVYAGQACQLRLHEALAYVGELQIQLVHSLNAPEEPTPFRAWIETGRFGMHHMAYFSQNIDADVARAEAQDFERTCEMRSKDGHRYFYCRSMRMPDVYIEFLEVYPLLTQIFEEGIADAARWDGTDPIRNIEYSSL
jgi:hypothetical protein